ncbi:hypothetical protein [Deinococcus ruber]|uniref:Uncharacterized protein n=1 Tax=Deinococcus ruber TaxID=1848197 RepID=A0A918CMX7_9DEIO|nr:hypothetical protein [Deinococcus ruber]GGR32969.1 hypothetical protein GCM10008957_49210 [Deinococcus ruber]
MFYIQAEDARILLEEVGRTACRLGDFDMVEGIQALATRYVQAVETIDIEELQQVKTLLTTLQQRQNVQISYRQTSVA